MSTPNVSRMVADRVAITDTVVSAIKIHGPEIVPIVEKALFPAGVPNNLRVADVITALGAHLERTTGALVTADRAHTTELADDDGYRHTRDERAVDLKELLGTLRANFIRNYGSTVAGAYGLSATLPDDASALLLLAGHVENFLRTRALTEVPKNKSLKIDPLLAADDVRDAAEALRTALGNVEREKREAQLTQGAKNEAMTSWSNAYPAVADGAAAFFSLGGRADLAQRVRPTARRRAGLPDDEAAGTEAPAAPVQGENTGTNNT
jgi:hypothetical protein